MKKTIAYANENGKTRLQAVEMVQNGYTQKKVAKEFGVHQSTISEWVKMYEEGGVDRLNTYRKPRPRYELGPERLAEEIQQEKSLERSRKLQALHELAEGGKLSEVAKRYNISVQALMTWRRQYLAVPSQPRALRMAPYVAAQKIKQLEETKKRLLRGDYKTQRQITRAKGIVSKLEKQLPALQEIAKNLKKNKI